MLKHSTTLYKCIRNNILIYYTKYYVRENREHFELFVYLFDWFLKDMCLEFRETVQESVNRELRKVLTIEIGVWRHIYKVNCLPNRNCLPNLNCPRAFHYLTVLLFCYKTEHCITTEFYKLVGKKMCYYNTSNSKFLIILLNV